MKYSLVLVMCLIDTEEKLVIFCCITVYRVGSAVDCVCKLVMCLINCQNLLNISAPIKTWLLFLLFRAPVIDVAKASSEQCHIVSWRRKLKTDLLNYHECVDVYLYWLQSKFCMHDLGTQQGLECRRVVNISQNCTMPGVSSFLMAHQHIIYH